MPRSFVRLIHSRGDIAAYIPVTTTPATGRPSVSTAIARNSAVVSAASLVAMSRLARLLRMALPCSSGDRAEHEPYPGPRPAGECRSYVHRPPPRWRRRDQQRIPHDTRCVRPLQRAELLSAKSPIRSTGDSALGDRAAPVFKHVGKRLLDRKAGLPTRRGAELLRVGNEPRYVDGADPRGIDVDFDRDSGQRSQSGQGVCQACASSGTEVVDLTAGAMQREQAVGADDVADVGEVADDFEVSHLDPRPEAGLDLGDLARETAEHVVRPLARTRVVERADDHDVEAV